MTQPTEQPKPKHFAILRRWNNNPTDFEVYDYAESRESAKAAIKLLPKSSEYKWEVGMYGYDPEPDQPTEPTKPEQWTCSYCGAVYAEYINGCPKCFMGEVGTASSVRLAPSQPEAAAEGEQAAQIIFLEKNYGTSHGWSYGLLVAAPDGTPDLSKQSPILIPYYNEIGHEAAKANASRAVASWNALSGIPTSDISSIPSKLQALREMEARKDAAYLERNQCVAGLAALSLASGYKTGIAKTAIEGWSEDWHSCVYIDLPTGQVSWHYHDSQAELFSFLPRYEGEYDGHDTPEKYKRVAAIASLKTTALRDVEAKLVQHETNKRISDALMTEGSQKIDEFRAKLAEAERERDEARNKLATLIEAVKPFAVLMKTEYPYVPTSPQLSLSEWRALSKAFAAASALKSEGGVTL